MNAPNEQEVTARLNSLLSVGREPGEYDELEAKALSGVQGYLMARGELPEFVRDNKITESDIVVQIKVGVLAGDPQLIALAANWLTLADPSKVRLKLKLEELYPFPDLWRPETLPHRSGLSGQPPVSPWPH